MKILMVCDEELSFFWNLDILGLQEDPQLDAQCTLNKIQGLYHTYMVLYDLTYLSFWSYLLILSFLLTPSIHWPSYCFSNLRVLVM